MRYRVALLLLLAIACRRESETPAPQPKPSPLVKPAAPPIANLLLLEHGATLVTRTAEQSYINSAAHMLDDDETTSWVSPTLGPQQTFVVSLPARTRVRSLGIQTSPGSLVSQLNVESSLDGLQWKTLGALSFEESGDRQMRKVPPFETRYLRLRTVSSQTFAMITQLFAEGDELEAPKPGTIDGCWSIDGRAARFEQRGAQVRGVIEGTDREKPIQIDGGFDGRAYRLLWRTGQSWGDTLLTVSPDAKSLSAATYFRSKNDSGIPANGWHGARGPCTATLALDPDSVRTRVFEQIGRYPLHALRFDGDRLLVADSAAALDFIAAHPGIRLVARNAPARLASLRDALAARGVDISKYSFVEGKAAGLPKLYAASIDME